MAHQRKEIRHAVAAALVAAGTSVGDRVFRTREVPYRKVELPALAVHTPDEDVEDGGEDTAPRELERALDLIVEGVVKAAEIDVDDALDDLALEVETALHADETFGGKASNSILRSTRTAVFGDGDRLFGVVRLEYRVTYYSYAPEETPADDFVTADVRQSLGGAVHPDNQAHDTVTVRED